MSVSSSVAVGSEFPVELVTGVIVGVLTSLLIIACKSAWSSWLFPMYLSYRYKGADLTGGWFAQYKGSEKIEDDSGGERSGGGEISTFTLSLQQEAHLISGSMQFTYDGPAKRFVIDYLVEGEYWEGYLNLYCKSKNRKSFSHASMFMKLILNGNGLLGNFSFRDADKDEVTTVILGLDRS